MARTKNAHLKVYRLVTLNGDKVVFVADAPVKKLGELTPQREKAKVFSYAKIALRYLNKLNEKVREEAKAQAVASGSKKPVRVQRFFIEEGT